MSAAQCHKAKNYNPGKEKESMQTSIAVIGIQRRLPRARVVYCSATGVSVVGNMAFMTRLVRAQMQISPLMTCLVGTLHGPSPLHAVRRLGCVHPYQAVLSPCCSLSGVIAGVCVQGLRGPGSAFADFQAFLDSTKRRGVPFMEMLAMELKAEGVFVERTLSFTCGCAFARHPRRACMHACISL